LEPTVIQRRHSTATKTFYDVLPSSTSFRHATTARTKSTKVTDFSLDVGEFADTLAKVREFTKDGGVVTEEILHYAVKLQLYVFIVLYVFTVKLQSKYETTSESNIT